MTLPKILFLKGQFTKKLFAFQIIWKHFVFQATSKRWFGIYNKKTYKWFPEDYKIFKKD